MRFTYPARLQHIGADEIVVSFRDLPECLTSGADEPEALAEAADALEEAMAGRMNRTVLFPAPVLSSLPSTGSGHHRLSIQGPGRGHRESCEVARGDGLPCG